VEVKFLKNLSIAVPDSVFEKFVEIQTQKGSKNQSDTLIYVVEEVHKRLLEEKEASM